MSQEDETVHEEMSTRLESAAPHSPEEQLEADDVQKSRSGSEDESSDADEEEEDAEQVEWLATTRAKRATAGNRMNAILQAEEPDDELELLFAEADDDVGFSDVEDGSDVQMDSSSDEDDQGPADVDDLEGEKELQRQVRAEAKKKKKDPIPRMFRTKKVRIDSTLPTTNTPPKKKKKRDRESWLTPEDGEKIEPMRQSARTTSQKQKQVLKSVLLDRENKRLKQLIHMNAAAAERAARAAPPMTQQDRLREAARVEKANAKSLYKWQETENAREEERKAKLAKLHDRTLSGPVITFWSGMAEYVGGKLRKVGKIEVEDKEKPARKRKAAELEAESEAGSTPTPAPEADIPAPTPVSAEPARKSSSPRPPDHLAMLPNGIPRHSNDKSTLPPPPISTFQPPPPLPPNSSVLAPPAGFSLFAPPHIPFAPQQSLDGSAPLSGLGYNHSYRQGYQVQSPYHNYPPIPPPRLPTPPPAIEHTLRSSLILSNFDQDAIKHPSSQLQVLFGPSTTFAKPRLPKYRLNSKRDVCAITGYPAKYRDPSTGLPYCNSYAYREIQRLKKGEYKWSKLVGAYVGLGSGVVAARGVPERFRAENIGQ